MASFSLFLDYLFNQFITTFILSIIGVLIREILGQVNKPKQKMNLLKLILTTFFVTVMACAIQEYVNLKFSIYALLVIVLSSQSGRLITLLMNGKLVSSIILKLFKRSASKVVANVADEISKSLEENEKKSEDSETKDKDPEEL